MDDLHDKIPSYEEDDVCYIVIDTETTGSAGIPTFHPKHQVVQICALHLGSKDTFMRYCRPSEGLQIPSNSTDIHKIGQMVVQTIGVSQQEAMVGLKEFVASHAEGRPVVMIAHNAPFDQQMVTKTLESELREYSGINYKDHPWKWFDTLVAFRELYPEIDREHWPEERPYSLGSLMEKFHPQHEMEDAHNAMADVVALSMLFVCQLVPKLGQRPILESKYITTYEAESGPRASKRLALVSEVKSIAAFRTCMLHSKVMSYFTSLGDEGSQYLRALGCFTCLDLLVYGYEKYKRRQKQPGSPSLPWWGALREIEILLRSEPLKIYSDNIIANVLATVLDVDVHTLALHFMKDDGSDFLFPTCSGEAIAYLPLVVSEPDAQRIRQKLGYRSMTDMLVDFNFEPDDSKVNWVRRLNACLETEYTISDLSALFEKTKLFGG